MKLKISLPLFASLLILAAGCKEVRDPEFRSIDNFGLKTLSLNEATVGFGVTYFNPNGFGVSVKEAEADIYVDSVYLGKFVQEQQVSVAKEANFTIPFEGSVPLRKAMEFDLENISNREVLLRAEGTVKVGKGGVYISRPINYQGRHRLDEVNFK